MSVNQLINIIPFSADLKDSIKELNMEWLEKYFRIEDKDQQVFSDPQSEIIDKGGMIFFAQYNDKIVGTISFLKINETTLELSKMAVTNAVQGLGIGNKLITYGLENAKKNRIKKLVLYSNTKLSPALYLYKKYGFQEISMDETFYERANIKMELIL